MAIFTRNKVNTLYARVPDLRRMLPRSFTKLTGVCPFDIVRGVMNSTEAGYKPQGAEPRDYTDFEQVLTGINPIIVEWEDSIEFPFDGDLDGRYDRSPSVKTKNSAGIAT